MTACRTVLVALAVTVTLASCGVTADPPPPTVAELRQTLLTVDDVGPGFTAADGDGDDEDDEGPSDVGGSKRCRSLAARIGGRGSEDSDAEAAFFTADGAAVFHAYDRPDGDGDDLDVDEVVELIDTCRTVTIDTGDSVGKARITGGPVDGLGDEAVELRVSLELTEPVEAAVESVFYLWQRDSVSGLVGAVDGIDPSTGEAVPVGLDQARDWAETADRRLADVIES